MAAISDTRRVTRSDLIAAATSTPATSGRNTAPASTRRTGRSSVRARIRCGPHPAPSSFPPSSFPRLSRAASVIARYRAPESRCAQPNRRATAAAVDDLPEAAGPSIAMTRTGHPLEVAEKPRVADGHGRAFGEPHVRSGQRGENRERHGEPMIARRLDPAAGGPRGAAYVQVIPLRLGGHANGAEIGGDQFEPVALFDPQLTDLAEHRLPLGTAREHREDRHLVHEGRHLRGGDDRAPEGGGAGDQVGDRLPPPVPPGPTTPPRPPPPPHRP